MHDVIIFENASLCLPEARIALGSLWIRGSSIFKIDLSSGVACDQDLAEIATDSLHRIDATGWYLSPGFIDLHVHGALGYDTMEGTQDAFESILRFHARYGTTTLALTTVCAPWEQLLSVLNTAKYFKTLHSLESACLAGIHLEGPFFSPHRVGAHDPAFLRLPIQDSPKCVLPYAEVITQMTLAPELPGAFEWIRALSQAGIRVSGGHTDAWEEESVAAIEHGLSQATHVFNCMSSGRRRGPDRIAGFLESALTSPHLYCELIADGHHVSPILMRLLLQVKGVEHTLLITDAVAGIGLPEGSSFNVGAVSGKVACGVAVTEDGSRLAGSLCTMIQGLKTLVQQVGLPLGQALRTATETPAKALGWNTFLGALKPGFQADLVLFNNQFEIHSTWKKGQRLTADQHISGRP